MNNISSLLHTISQGEYDSTFSVLYHEDSIAHQRERYTHLLELFAKTFPDSDTPRLFSAPGRTEISGNHTDHQHGCVVAASINLDMIAAASKNNKNSVRIQSEGFDFEEICLDDLSVHETKSTPPLPSSAAPLLSSMRWAIRSAVLISVLPPRY